MGDPRRTRTTAPSPEVVQVAPVLWRTLLDLVGDVTDGDLAPRLSAWREDAAQLRPPPILTTRQVNDLVGTVLRRHAHVPVLGIEVGGRQTLTSFGPAGIAMMTSRTLGEALQLGLKYQRLIGTPLLLHERREGGEVQLRLHGGPGLRPQVEGFLVEEMISSLLAIIRSETGQELRSARVEITRTDLPLSTRLHYQRTFRTVVFGSDASLLAFPEAALHLPLLRHDPVTHQDALQWCERLAHTHPHGAPASMDQRVRDTLRALPPESWHLTDVARVLSLHPRTVRHRLEQVGTSFRDLRAELIREQADEWLRHSDLTVEEIAQRLGFSDARSFRRAVKHWTGLTPLDVRRSR